MQKSLQYDFTTNWFETTAKTVWDIIIPQINPAKILEIGSFEGASTCYLIDMLSKRQAIEIHCVDTWEGGIEHQAGGGVAADMPLVEQRFLHNTGLAQSKADHKVDLFCHKGTSEKALAELLVNEKSGYFDFIYVDGSHQAPDVLYDAILSFRLLKVGGFMVFDDYLWSEFVTQSMDPIRCPKPGIDAFTNVYCRKIRLLSLPLYQLYLQKISD